MKSKIEKKKIQKEDKKTFGNKEVFFLIVTTSIISIIMGAIISGCFKEKQNNYSNDKTLSEFIKTYNNIVNNYYEKIDKKELLNGAINGMLSNLDEYSTVIDNEEDENFSLSLNGNYDGVGIQIINDENSNIVIVNVLDNSPAEKAGIKEGDIAKKIDDIDLTQKNIKELSNYVKENNKLKYNLVVERNGKTLTFELEKKNIIIKSVTSKIIERENKKIGYIYVSIFSNTTASQFKNNLKSLEKQNIDSLIIDVRENSGGHLTTAVSMLSAMLSSDKVIYQVEKDNKITKYYSLGEKNKKYKIVILQNNNSASASELFTAALKEQLNATVVGDTSYGKGTIQELNYLSNGSSYKYTTKKWLTSKGLWIHKKGIVPDIKVAMDEKYYKEANDENDNQLQTAINELIK